MTNDDEEIELDIISGQGEPGNGSAKPASCSFCGKSEAEVNCLLAGSSALICDDCIARYKDELKENV